MLRFIQKIQCASNNNVKRVVLVSLPNLLLKRHTDKSFSHSCLLLAEKESTHYIHNLFKSIPSLNSLQRIMDASLLLPPSNVQGMTVLDREAFLKKVSVPFLRVQNEHLNSTLKCFKKLMLKMEKLKPVQTDIENENKKLILLNPLLVKDLSDIKEEHNQLSQGCETEFFFKEITLCYENWKAEDIIKAILPENVEGAQGYSIIGHIIHLNLRENVLPYKTVIGEVLLDKSANITLVVNKTNIIDSTFRNFAMECLAGTGSTDVTVKENGCSYLFDFAKVYWNPRLSTEHTRIVGKIKQGDVLLDIMAGVGPFAIPAARKKCDVYANDLNQHSYESLIHNCSVNKVKDRVKCFNLDGHEFIRTVLKEKLLEVWNNSYFCGAIHITMNLPAMAVEFLPSFMGIISETDKIPEKVTLPIVHVYMFVKDTLEDTAVNVVAEKLGYDVKDEMIDAVENGGTDQSMDCGKLQKSVEEVSFIRSVAPNKNMMRVSFRLPLDILRSADSLTQGPPAKKLKES